MKFPEITRVLYGANPLVDVICHITFPRILAIDNELPVDFQEALISRFPLLETKNVRKRGSDASADDDAGRGLTYEFASSDKQTMVVLGSDFLGIRTFQYERWEIFKEHIENAIRTLLATYTLSVFTSLSLNYINVVDKDALGLKDVRWADLIRGSLIGPFSETSASDDDLFELHSFASLKIDDGVLRIISGLVQKTDTKNTSFLIDNEFVFDESMDADEHKSLAVLRRFNLESGRVFRWCITDKLHQVLRPSPL